MYIISHAVVMFGVVLSEICHKTLTGDAPKWPACAAQRAENGHKKGSVGHPTHFGPGQSKFGLLQVGSKCSQPSSAALRNDPFSSEQPST